MRTSDQSPAEPQMLKLWGPFTQALTLRGLRLRGPLSDEQLELIPQAGLLTQGGTLIEVGSWADLCIRYPQAVFERVEPLCEMRGIKHHELTVTPGLIDAHTHLCFAGSRARDYADRLNGVSYEEITARGGGIRETMKFTREATQGELFTLNSERLSAHLRRGVTTVEIKSGYGLSVEAELKQLRAMKSLSEQTPQRVISTCLAAHVLPPEYDHRSRSSDPLRPQDISAYLNEISAHLLPQIRAEGFASRIDAFIEPSAFSVDLARPYLERARDLGFSLTLHADQFTRGGALLAAELGAVSADHLEASKDEDLVALVEAQVCAIALPGASLGLGIPYAPVRRALDLGASVAIASDWNPGSAPMGHLLLQASVLGAAERLSAAEIWAGLTVRAAHALNLTDLGALDQGYSADFIAFPTSDYREVLYHQGMIEPSMVWAQGKLT